MHGVLTWSLRRCKPKNQLRGERNTAAAQRLDGLLGC
jgi:hypothetical protein